MVAAGLLITAPAVADTTTQAITPVPPQAARRAATVHVHVVPDHRDWTYALGEPVHFRVTLTADDTALDPVTVHVTHGPDMMPAPTTDLVVPPEGVTIDAGTMKEPGFLRCVVTTEVAGRTYKGAATAAFAPERIHAYQEDVPDFDAFWAAGKAELAAIPMDAILTPKPEAATSTVDVYQVSFRTIGPNWTAVPARIYGILCVPKAPGPHPAVLEVPGAGVRPYFGDPGLASHGAITLQIGIHGIPVDMPQNVYDQLGAGALNGYWQYNIDDPNTFYYRRVILGCLRAVDYLTSRPDWDGKHVLVMGASQGGFLTIATAALDPRITALAATHPAMCDMVAELHGRAGGWPHPFMPDASGKPSHHTTAEKIKTAGYYDTTNFARRIHVPGHYSWGYNDDVCPPTSCFAAYNLVTAPKELTVTLELGHAYTPEQWEATDRWVRAALGL